MSRCCCRERVSADSAERRSAITAARIKVVSATTPMKVWSRKRLFTAVEVAKGPTPRTVYQMASAETTKIAIAAPRDPNRRAAQMVTGKMAYT